MLKSVKSESSQEAADATCVPVVEDGCDPPGIDGGCEIVMIEDAIEIGRPEVSDQLVKIISALERVADYNCI